MSGTYLIGYPGAYHVTNADGTTSLVPGFPITEMTPPQAAMLAGLITDADSVLAPAVSAAAAGQTLAPALYADADIFHTPTLVSTSTLVTAPVIDTETFHTGAVGAASFLLPALIDDSDAIHAPGIASTSQSLLPALVAGDDSFNPGGIFVIIGGHPKRRFRPDVVSDNDVVFASAIGASLKPGFLAGDDVIYAANNITAAKGTAFVPSDDVVFPFVTTLFVQPGFVSDDDVVPASDVGWRLYADATVADVDAVYGSDAFAYNDLLPDIFGDEDSTETFPFFVQQLQGGVPVPERPHLTGSLSQRRVLHGSLSRTVHLRGSIKNTRRLTGSIGPRIGTKKR